MPNELGFDDKINRQPTGTPVQHKESRAHAIVSRSFSERLI